MQFGILFNGPGRKSHLEALLDPVLSPLKPQELQAIPGVLKGSKQGLKEREWDRAES